MNMIDLFLYKNILSLTLTPMYRFWLLFSFICVGLTLPIYGQNGYTVSIVGPTDIELNASYNYYIEWEYLGNPAQAPTGGTYNWSIYGGTSNVAYDNYAYINWTESAGSIIFEYTAAGVFYYATLNVQSSDCAPRPSVSFSLASSSCSPRDLSYTGTPPNGIEWYWQTSPTGTNCAHSGDTYQITSSGTYYVRAYNISAECWGPDVASYYVPSVVQGPATPGAPIILQDEGECGSKALMQPSSPPNAVTWYWQGNDPNGTEAGYSGSEVYLALASGTYYLRARDNSSGCWSANSSSVNVTINEVPVPTAPVTTSHICGPQTLTKSGNPTSGVLWYWQGTNANGTDYISQEATAPTYTAQTSGRYYLRSRGANGCWGYATFVDVNVNILPTPLVPTGLSTTGETTSSFMIHCSSVAGVDSYVFEVANNPSFNINAIVKTVTSASPSALIEGLSINPFYPNFYYRVRAVKECVRSSFSEVGSTVLIPQPPVATEATQVSTNQFALNWEPSPSATGYFFDISINSNFSSFVSGFEDRNSSDFNGFTGNPMGQLFIYSNVFPTTTTYFYRVRAFNTSGVSANSNIRSVIPAPVALEATNLTTSSFMAHWSVVQGANEYEIEVSTDISFSSVVTTVTFSNSSEGTISGLEQGLVYYYRVRAKNPYGISEPSNIVKVLTNKIYGNYIKTTTALNDVLFSNTDISQASIGEKLVEIVYFDGIGRPVQSVNQQSSPQGKDIVKPVFYDAFGRQTKDHLPYVATTTTAVYQPNAAVEQYQFIKMPYMIILPRTIIPIQKRYLRKAH
ncbi:MAG: fibronectin type III domain-containing protein [Bacteroidia bacterium]|nr:fibronectin type III domain-containing protein [Bacteroidia bacterium]